MPMELRLLTPEARIYDPLPAQAAFHRSAALNKAYILAEGRIW
jgi:hypothetical protein